MKTGNVVHNLYRYFWLKSWLIITSILSAPLQAKTIELASVEGLATTKITEDILQHAYATIDVKVIFDRLPLNRSLILSDSGKLDGESTRTAQIVQTHPNLIKVPTSIYSVNTFLFLNPKYKGPTELSKFKDKRIGIVRGAAQAKDITHGLNVYEATTDKQLILMLQTNRLDAAIFGVHDIRQLDAFPNMHKVVVVQQPLRIKPLYHFIHKKHAQLVPRINEALVKLKQDGYFDQVADQYFANTIASYSK